MDEHPDSVDRSGSPGACGRQQRRLDRVVHEINDDLTRRDQVSGHHEPLATHPHRRGVDHDRGRSDVPLLADAAALPRQGRRRTGPVDRAVDHGHLRSRASERGDHTAGRSARAEDDTTLAFD